MQQCPPASAVPSTRRRFRGARHPRHDLSRRLFELTDDIASFAWTDDELQSLHRGFSREMSREVKALAALEPLAWHSPSASAPHVA
jgi:hypothetical protein